MRIDGPPIFTTWNVVDEPVADGVGDGTHAELCAICPAGQPWLNAG